MKLNVMAMANAFGVIGALYFLGCYLVASFTPEIYKAIAATWFHMLDLSSAWKSAPNGFLLGLVSFTAVSWISGWVFAWTYNKLIK